MQRKHCALECGEVRCLHFFGSSPSSSTSPPVAGRAGMSGSMPAIGRLSGTPPIHGNHFDHFQTCPAVSYPKHSEICTDLQCSSAGQVCLSCGWGPNSTNLAACCEKDDMPLPDKRGRYPCERQYVTTTAGIFCKFGCCTTGSTVCGDGCCKPGDSGATHNCGRSLPTRHGKGRKPCCVVEGSSPSKQEESGCCIRGDGLNCLQNETPCCLWTQGNERAQDPDPHSPCQPKNCSLYQACAHGEGYDCTEHGQRICCLRPGGARAVSEADPCQPQEVDCQNRWTKCSHGVGSECSRNVGSACCLPPNNSSSNPCQEDCRNYTVPSLFQHWWFWIGPSILLMIFMLIPLVRWRRRRAREVTQPANCQVDRPDRPPALVICNSKYEGNFDPLPWAMKDGESICRMLDKLGFHVIECNNLSESELHQSTQRLVTELQQGEFKTPVVPIYYAGHGTEVAGTQFLVPISAKDYSDPLISLDSLMECPAKAYLEDGSQIKPLYFCILDACRSQPRSQADRIKLAAAAASKKKQAVRRKQNLKPDFVILNACEAANWAQQCPDTGHGFLTKAFLHHGWREMPLSLLLETLMQQVEQETLQRATYQQKPELTKNCSTLHTRFLGPKMTLDVSSRSTSASCIDVSSLCSGSRGERSEGPAVMTSAMQALLSAPAESAPTG